MAEIKLTKNELRAQQRRLSQLEKYLPTLQLKKAMLQSEVQRARLEIQQMEQALVDERSRIERSCALLSEPLPFDPVAMAHVTKVEKRYENFAGVEVPLLIEVVFDELTYSLLETPPWVDGMIVGLRSVAAGRVRVNIAEEKKGALERELREVSIRVNLFEKILIPRARANIRKIRVFLGDQELAAVGRAKVAKEKIEATRRQETTHAY